MQDTPKARGRTTGRFDKSRNILSHQKFRKALADVGFDLRGNYKAQAERLADFIVSYDSKQDSVSPVSISGAMEWLMLRHRSDTDVKRLHNRSLAMLAWLVQKDMRDLIENEEFMYPRTTVIRLRHFALFRENVCYMVERTSIATALKNNILAFMGTEAEMRWCMRNLTLDEEGYRKLIGGEPKPNPVPEPTPAPKPEPAPVPEVFTAADPINFENKTVMNLLARLIAVEIVTLIQNAKDEG